MIVEETSQGNLKPEIIDEKGVARVEISRIVNQTAGSGCEFQFVAWITNFS
jgi:hypothetical protein